MDKLETINNSINEIREILDAECTPIEQLPNLVREVSEEAAKSGYTTVFVFSIESNPVTPTGSFNPTTGLVEGLENGGTQTIKATNVNFFYMSFAVFNSMGEIITDGSTPINLKGSKGDSGIAGEKGEKGEQGLPGEKGESGISYRTVSVYTTTDSVDIIPGRPKGGHWDMKTNALSLPVTDDGTRWGANVDDEPNPKKFIGTSNVTFQNNGNPMGKWSIPFRITGEDGKNGADGRVIEFIYRLLPNYDTYLVLRDFLNKPENKLPSLNEPDYIPEVNDSLNVGTKWEDRPTGIDPTMQIEVACNRVRGSVDEPWGEGSNCTIGSKGGEDGMDGDGIEYIYLVTPAEINGIPTTSGHVKDTMVPTYSLEGDYQNDEFCFNDEWGFEGYDGTDEPRDVGPGEPMEWVMVRKQKDGVGQSFSDPALGATYSEDGVSYITSFVFTRASISNPPTQPKGGDYHHAYPTADGSETGYKDENWNDSVPSDGNLPVWMSIRTFCSDHRYNDDDGSEPKMLADTPDFQVEYTAYEGEISRERLDKFTGESTEANEEAGRASQLSKYEIEWGDDTKIKNPVGMITATRHGGEWSDWTISKIKGEKGDKGDPGSSVRIEGQFETLDQLKDAWSDYVNTGSLDKFHFESKDGVINLGDGWYVVEDGKLYSYSGGGSKDEDDSRFETYGFGTPIKGEPGNSAYMYIAYCNENNANAAVDLIGPGKYIGIKVTDKPLTETEQKSGSTYTWTKGEGEDGFGQEQIFLATSTNLDYNPEKAHLPLPTDNSQIAELLPTHSYGSDAYPHDKWSDTPVTPTPEYPFCWVATRKCQGSKFENWKGTDGVAALYSRGSYDGVSNVYVDLSNDLAVIPMEDGKVDPDFTDPVQTVVRVWVGDEQVPSTDFTVTGNNVTINGATVTLNLSALNSNIKSIPLNVELGGKTHSVNGKILQTDVAYELTPKTYSIKRYVTGDKIGQLELDELTVDIWKWSDNKWVASNIPLFAHIVYTDDSEEILSTSDGRVTVSKNGVVTINLKGLLNVASIKVYVVAQNENGEYISNSEPLSFENITVVADGVPGEDGKNGEDGKDGADGKDGEDGKDGPGIEYVYIITGPDANAATLHNELLSCYNDSRYQNDDFYPNKNNGYPNSDGTDDPQNVSAEKPFEWVSKRKKSNGVWGEFSLPAIWAKYTTDGKDAFEYKTSYVFTRATSTPNPPEGGKFSTGLPENTNVGKDTISQSGEGEVGMSYRMFRSDDTKVDDGSTPMQMTDTSKFEVIYGVATANLSSLPILPITDGITNYNGGYDNAEAGVEFHYMATATYSNNKGSNWTVSKIKGEKGDKGEDGKSVTIKGKFNTISDLQLAGNKYFDDPVNAGFVYPLSMGDGYLVEGDLWVYDGDGTNFADSGNNVGKIQGESGQSMYMYVRYSNDGGQTMLEEGNVGKYLGMYIGTTDLTAEQKSNPTTYNPGTKGTGDDGGGGEQVFKATSDNNPPYITSSQQNLSEQELINIGGSDKPISVSETNKYIGYLVRKSNSYWNGETIANGRVIAALFDRYAKDGETGPQGPQGEQGIPGENGKDAVISQAMLDQAAANITQGFYTKEQIDALETSLNNAISSGDAKAIADAAAALNTANEVNTELTSLQSKFNDDGTIKDSILREEDIYNLSKAALGTDISENGVFAQQIVGLVGTYGKINVDNLVGDTISGKTVQSADANGNLGKAGKLENTGAGHIANGQISGNADGSEINLGSNVKISWSDNISDSDKATIKTYSQDGTVSNDVFNEEVGSLQTRMESVENDLPNYALLSELSNEVKKEVNGLGFVTDEQLNEYLKSSDLNGSIELYLLNSKSEVADIIGDSVLAKLDKEALSTELGKDYIKTGTTFTNTLFSGDIYGKSIKNDSSGSIGSIKEDGSASFCSGKINFNKNGSGNLGAGLSGNQDGTTTLSNQLIFKSGYLTSGDYQNQISWDDEGGSIDLDLKQQGVLDTSIKYGTLYLNESQCQYNNITNINILNVGNYVSRIDNGDIPFVLGSKTGMLILPGHSLFTGMTFDGNCYCPSNYYITKCSGGRDGNVNYITPGDNPGYAMSVRDYDGTRNVVDNTTSSIGTTLLDITVSCPKIVVEYDTDSVRAQKTSSGGSNQRLFFTLNNTVATQRQYYIDIYFYFNELCVGRYCVSGNAEIHDD